MPPLICSSQCIVVSVSAKGSAYPSQSTPVVLYFVSLILISGYVPQKTTESLILSLVVRAKRGALLCCRPSLQGQALLSPFGLDLSLTVHIQGVREQRECDMGAMRNKAEIPVPDPTSIHLPLHSTLFQRCCSARLNVIWLHKTLAVSGHSRSACPLGDEFPNNL